MEELLRNLLREEIGPFRDEVNNRFDSLEKRLDNLDAKVGDMDTKVGDMDTKISDLALKVNESHQWIRTLVENKDVQKAEMDNLQHKVTAVEGVLQGFDKSLEKLTKAQ